ncbi:MAG: thiolase family protein, partial [Deltaproteobacteria bacterium]|nr:thiolase family protein [Deltaproteobacteria bacterium]
MREIAIVAGVRTPFGRAVKGSLKDTRPEAMAAPLIEELLRRVPQVKAADIEDLLIGCAMPEGEQGLNIARIIGLLGGLPVETPAATINRFCSSGLQAIAMAAGRMAAGEISIALAGGVESMSMVPMGGNKTSLNPELADRWPEVYMPMGLTAELVARRFEISRAEQDRFALASHQKAIAAQKAGRFQGEILPIPATVYDAGGHRRTTTFSADEMPRADGTLEKLAALKPAFDPKGTVTAGNASPLTDGAAMVLMLTREEAEKRSIKPLGHFRQFVVKGVPPEIMGIGPVPAIRALLTKTGLRIADIDLFEVNEAFAAQAAY